jgi:hypothetical protein
MGTFLLSFLLVCLAVVGLAAGVLLGRQPLSGGCGATAACWMCSRRRRCARAARGVDGQRDAQPPCSGN